MLNLEWLRTFKAIYESGNLTAAAQTLFISQPGVSLHLNSLETYTGYPLFRREARKMTPTERGIILYNCVLDSLNKLEETEQSFFRNSQATKSTVSVGMGVETFEYTLEEHLAELPFNLILRFNQYSEMLQDVDAGRLDLIVTPQKGLQANLEYSPFIRERIVMICGSQTDLTQLNELMADNDKPAIRQWLKQQVWYTTATGMEHLSSFWMTNFDQLPDLTPNYVLPHSSSILRCLCNGNGFAIMPDFLCRKAITNKRVRLVWEGSPHVENVLYFCKRKKNSLRNEIRQLEELLVKNVL